MRLQLDALRSAPWAWAQSDGTAAWLAALGVRDEDARALGEEAPESLAARTAKPGWARTAERALELAPEHSADGPAREALGPDADGAEVFLPVLRPMLAAAWGEAAQRLTLPTAEREVVRSAFERRLGARLARQAARTLVTRMHKARRAGELVGSTPRDRFADFVAEAGTRGGLTGLFADYPVLARLLGQGCADAVESVVELAGRLRDDRADLVAGLLDGVDPGPLTGLDLGLGDSHQGDRSVAVLTFADGRRVVCKPRPLDQHALLDELTGWLNRRVPALELRSPRSLRRPGYGWLEFVEHRWCSSTAQADRFYRRQGALLALLYAVDGADMHFENVIACGDQPVLVDAETLLHGGLPLPSNAGHDPAADALAASVQRTCLLPVLLIGEQGALDISALGRVDAEAYPSAGLRWESAGTDAMRAVRSTVISPGAQNQPLPRELASAVTDHRAALLSGFRAGYDAVTEHRAELLAADGPLARWANAPARLIVRATRLYTTLLEESTHPDLLGDALARDAVFAVLWTESAQDPARQRLVEHEIADLWRGDVPLFTHRPQGTAVWTSTGVGLEGVLPGSALAAVHAKIAAMGEVDRHGQEWVIAASLAVAGSTAPGEGPRSRLREALAPTPVPPTSGRLLAAACGVADELVARAVYGEDRANWLGLEQIADAHWAVLPMGAGLAQGYTGVALFLAQAGRLAGAERYTELARAVLRPLPALLRALALDPALSLAAGPGALDGLGGIVHGLLRLRELLGAQPGTDTGSNLDRVLGDGPQDCLALALTALAQAAGSGIEDAIGDGLGDGLAGALAAAVAVQRATGSRPAAALARTVADELLTRLEARTGPRARPGFATGDAGIGWALLRFAVAQDAPGAVSRHAVAGTALLRAALATARRDPEVVRDGSWYAGLPGVVLAATELPGPAAELPGPAAELPDTAADLEELAAAVDEVAGRLLRHDLSLGRGALGALETLGRLAECGSRTARAALERRTGELLGAVELLGPRCGTPDQVATPGLLNGLAGIGYGLLRLACPDQVPSLLLLEPATTGRPPLAR